MRVPRRHVAGPSPPLWSRRARHRARSPSAATFLRLPRGPDQPGDDSSGISSPSCRNGRCSASGRLATSGPPWSPAHRLTYALIGVAVASGGVGVVWAIRDESWRRPCSGRQRDRCDVSAQPSRPYSGGKVMMIVSLTAVLRCDAGCSAAGTKGTASRGSAPGRGLGGAILWTNVSPTRYQLAPRQRMHELAASEPVQRSGPELFNLSDEYATYFLRDLAPADPPRAARSPPGRRP